MEDRVVLFIICLKLYGRVGFYVKPSLPVAGLTDALIVIIKLLLSLPKLVVVAWPDGDRDVYPPCAWKLNGAMIGCCWNGWCNMGLGGGRGWLHHRHIHCQEEMTHDQMLTFLSFSASHLKGQCFGLIEFVSKREL